MPLTFSSLFHVVFFFSSLCLLSLLLFPTSSSSVCDQFFVLCLICLPSFCFFLSFFLYLLAFFLLCLSSFSSSFWWFCVAIFFPEVGFGRLLSNGYQRRLPVCPVDRLSVVSLHGCYPATRCRHSAAVPPIATTLGQSPPPLGCCSTNRRHSRLLFGQSPANLRHHLAAVRPPLSRCRSAVIRRYSAATRQRMKYKMMVMMIIMMVMVIILMTIFGRHSLTPSRDKQSKANAGLLRSHGIYMLLASHSHHTISVQFCGQMSWPAMATKVSKFLMHHPICICGDEKAENFIVMY